MGHAFWDLLIRRVGPVDKALACHAEDTGFMPRKVHPDYLGLPAPCQCLCVSPKWKLCLRPASLWGIFEYEPNMNQLQ